ncbi:helix-turn-helix domain-containing protein [Nocardiopsis sp. NPDC058789]|uniref:helix-turn-helix domain-containing protein n=1 Tax=Nocardiopsis TaxID=2013 RepID=UPI00366AB6A0
MHSAMSPDGPDRDPERPRNSLVEADSDAEAAPRPTPETGVSAMSPGRNVSEHEPVPDGADAEAWARTLALLAADREALVDDFLRRLDGLGGYRERTVPDTDLRATASDTLDMLIRQIAGQPLPAHLVGLPVRLGRRRARQGVARERLLEAVRLDFRVLWAGLARAGGAGSADVLVQHAEEILTIVERYIGDVQVAFLEEQAVLLRDSRALTAQALSRLLNAGDRAAEVASEVAGTLGLPERGRFEVAFVTGLPRDEAWRRLVRDREHDPCLTWEFDEGTALVRESGGAGWPPLPREVNGGRVSGADGLASVPAAVEAARVLARYARPGELVQESRAWSALARDRIREALPGFGREHLRGMERLDPEHRARLVETLSHYAATGSVKETATSLYCHRNTVVNRLQAFREATGLDPTVPREAALALVLFAAPEGPGTREPGA